MIFLQNTEIYPHSGNCISQGFHHVGYRCLQVDIFPYSAKTNRITGIIICLLNYLKVDWPTFESRRMKMILHNTVQYQFWKKVNVVHLAQVTERTCQFCLVLSLCQCMSISPYSSYWDNIPVSHCFQSMSVIPDDL